MRKWVGALLAVGALGLGCWWFWSLGVLPAESQNSVTLRIDRGSAEVRRAQGAWEPAKDGIALVESDGIRTSSDGDARVVFSDRAESRLGPSTELSLGSLNLLRSGSIETDVRLGGGRIWSRVLRLLDLDDHFTVSAGSVIATVRGTSFDLRTEATSTVLWVSDSAVEVRRPDGTSASPNAQEPLVVSEGYMAKFDALGTADRTEPIPEESKQGDWFLSNITKDKTFIADAAKSHDGRFMSLDPVRPGTLTDGIARFSERLHLSLTPVERRPRLAVRYALRRIVGVKLLIEEGKSGAASQALSSLEEELRGWDALPDASERLRELRFALAEISELLVDIGPSSPLYRLKQKIEDFRVTFAGSDAALVAFARLAAIEGRLDEAEMLIESSSLDEAKSALDAARQGIGNVERDLDALADGVSKPRLDTLRGRLFAQKAREIALRTRLAAALQPPDFAIATSTDSGTATSTDMTATSTTATSTEVVPVRLLISASPNPATLGDIVSFVVKGTDESGKTVDLTSTAKFTLSSFLGTLNGPTLKTTATGTATLSVEVTNGDKTLTGTLGLTVRDPAKAAVTVRSIRVIAPKTQLVWNETMPITVQAVMSDGTTQDVTGTAKLSSSNAILGYFTQNIFHAGSTATGTAQIIATDGSGMRGTADVVIVSQ